MVELKKLWCRIDDERAGCSIMPFDLTAGACDVIANMIRVLTRWGTIRSGGIISIQLRKILVGRHWDLCLDKTNCWASTTAIPVASTKNAAASAVATTTSLTTSVVGGGVGFLIGEKVCCSSDGGGIRVLTD